MKKRKIVMVGCGYVGATSIFSMMSSGVCNHIAVIDYNREKAEGDVMDMNDGISFLRPTTLTVSDYADCRDTDIIVITAGAAQQQGQTRNDLLAANIKIFRSILDQVMPNLGDNTVILVVTNPVDVLTHFTRQYTGLPANRVLGSGTVLDTARLKYETAQHTGVDARDVHTFVIGEHGDTSVAAFSSTHIAGLSLQEYCSQCQACNVNLTIGLENHVRNAAYEIINKKGATFYAVALTVNRIVEAILNDQKAILTVSTHLNGQYNLHDICLSLPCVVGAKGVERVLTPPLNDEETQALHASAKAIRDNLEAIQ
ncbi:MAG: L-lactate dehydrogenase [Oscillospiraceae bacterium]|nr:L-lactate dehydrogenase [Oscillospiraceae bacterium]